MSFGGGAAWFRTSAGGDWSRLVTVYLRPASGTPLSSTIRLNRSARRVPAAVTVLAGYGTGSAKRASWLTAVLMVIEVVTEVAHELSVWPGGSGSSGLAGTSDSGWLNSFHPELVRLSST